MARTTVIEVIERGPRGAVGQVSDAELAAAIAAHASTDASDAELAAHAADTTAVHGITDTADLPTKSGSNDFTGSSTFPEPTVDGNPVRNDDARLNDVLRPRDYGAKFDGRTFRNGVMTSGSNVLHIPNYTASADDVGKWVSVAKAGSVAAAGVTSGNFLLSTVTGVSGGDLLLADNAAHSVAGDNTVFSASAEGNVVLGTDDTVSLQEWLDALGSATGDVRVGLLPHGMTLFSQLIVPTAAVIRGAGWGNMGNLYGSGFAGTSNTLLHQIGGVDDDAIIFTRTSVGVDYVLADMADFLLEQNLANASGSGIVCRDEDGTPLATSDGFRLRNINIGGFAEDGFVINGAVPLHLPDCRAVFNLGAGLRYVSQSNDWGAHFDNFSGDANGAGCVFIKGLGTGSLSGAGHFEITNLKGEKALNPYRPLGGYQESVLVIEDVKDQPVIVQGLENASAVVNAGTPEAPGPAIRINDTGGGGTWLPNLRWDGVVCRQKSLETTPPSGLGPLAIYESANTKSIPPSIASGKLVAGGTDLDYSIGFTARRHVFGNKFVYSGAGGLAESPGTQIAGTKPVVSMVETDATANRQQYAVYANGDALHVVTLLDDGTVSKEVLLIDRAASALTLHYALMKLGISGDVLQLPDGVSFDRGLRNPDRTPYGQWVGRPPDNVLVPASANRMYARRFVPDVADTVKAIAFVVGTGATSNDSCDVGILDSAGTKIVSSGATAGKLNGGAAGVQTITIADTPVVPGTEYWIVFAYGAIGGTAAQLAGVNTGIGVANNALAQTINTTPQAKTAAWVKDTAYPIATTAPSAGGFVALTPALAVRF